MKEAVSDEAMGSISGPVHGGVRSGRESGGDGQGNAAGAGAVRQLAEEPSAPTGIGRGRRGVARPISAWPRGVPGEGDAVRRHQQAARHGRVLGARRRLVKKPLAMAARPEARRSLASAAADQSRGDAWVMGSGSDESLRLSPFAVGGTVVSVLRHRDAAWGRVAAECFGLVPGRRGALGPKQQDGPGASGAGSRDDLAVLGSVFAEIEGERNSGRGGGGLNKNLSHLRGFLDYAWRSGRADRNVLDHFQIKDDGRRREPESLSVEEAVQLVKACPASTPVQRRDRIVILLLYGCGLRTKELCDLRLQDVRYGTEGVAGAGRQGRPATARAVAGDGLYRTVGVPLGTRRETRAAAADREAGQGSSRKHICEVVCHAAEQAGIAREVTPKALRHSYATHLMDRGVDLAVIAKLMGHRSPAETGVYLHVLKDRPQRAVNRLDLSGGEAT